MDIINETLARVRAGVEEALAESGAKRDDLVDELAQAVADLDEALCTGMALPKPWARWWQRAVTVPTPEQREQTRDARALELERRAFRLRNALLEVGVPENLVRAVELGGEEQEEREQRLRTLHPRTGNLRTDDERRAQPEGLPQGVYREGPDL